MLRPFVTISRNLTLPIIYLRIKNMKYNKSAQTYPAPSYRWLPLDSEKEHYAAQSWQYGSGDFFHILLLHTDHNSNDLNTCFFSYIYVFYWWVCLTLTRSHGEGHNFAKIRLLSQCQLTSRHELHWPTTESVTSRVVRETTIWFTLWTNKISKYYRCRQAHFDVEEERH